MNFKVGDLLIEKQERGDGLESLRALCLVLAVEPGFYFVKWYDKGPTAGDTSYETVHAMSFFEHATPSGKYGGGRSRLAKRESKNFFPDNEQQTTTEETAYDGRVS